MQNILIFPAGIESGLEINKSLKYSNDFNVIAASSVKDHSKFIYNEVNYLPFVYDENFIFELNKLIKKENIDYIFPANDDVILELSRKRDLINAEVVLPNKNACEITRFKKMTYDFFKGYIPVPEVFEFKEIKPEHLPLFYKPNQGQGSQNAGKLVNYSQLEMLSDQYVFMELLTGDEYTVDCFTDRHGEVLYSRSRKRVKTRNGIAVSSVIDDEYQGVINNYAKIISEKLSLRGVWFFQVKLDKNNVLKLLEVAPRVAGTMCLSRINGINLPLLSLYDLKGLDVKIIKQTLFKEVSRSLDNKYQINFDIDECYFDFDDTIFFKNKLNKKIIEIIVDFRNKNIKCILLSRHKGDLNQRLIDLNIIKLFDEVVHITDGSKKSAYIKSKNSIFIDDSFKERSEVYESLGIPVFDLSMIEAF